MPWVPLADSGIAFTPALAEGVTVDGSTVVGVHADLPIDQSWSIQLASPVRIRVSVQEFDSSSYSESGSFIFFDAAGSPELVDNVGGPNEWSPNPIESTAAAASLAYSPGEQSGYASDSYRMLIEVETTVVTYNCECDDGQPTVTLKQMRERLARRLGFSVQVSMGALPPGMPELLDDFTRSAHELMYRRYSVMRLRRMFTWDLAAGVRFYDIDGNSDSCPRILNPDKLEWVGISQGDSSWRPLICGINPVLYGSHGGGIPSHYEIRQCIEIWPAPTDDTWKLRIKGDFGPSQLEADLDVLTVDPEAVFLQALANAKAHYGQADAANYASQATAYVRSRVAGSHQTRRYIPGSCVQPPAVRPLLKED